MLRLAASEAEGACGLSAAQLFVLEALADAPAQSLAEVAERTLTDQSSVSTVVARLVAQGLVERRASRTDRRRAELRLTPAGYQVVLTAPRMPQTRLIAALRAMPAARRAEIATALDRLVTAFGAEGVAPRMLFEDEDERRSSSRSPRPDRERASAPARSRAPTRRGAPRGT